MARFNLRKFEGAIKDFSIGISLKNVRVELYINRGVAYFQTGNYKEAEVDFELAVKMNPEMPQIYYHLGLVR